VRANQQQKPGVTQEVKATDTNEGKLYRIKEIKVQEEN